MQATAEGRLILLLTIHLSCVSLLLLWVAAAVYLLASAFVCCFRSPISFLLNNDLPDSILMQALMQMSNANFPEVAPLNVSI